MMLEPDEAVDGAPHVGLAPRGAAVAGRGVRHFLPFPNIRLTEQRKERDREVESSSITASQK